MVLKSDKLLLVYNLTAIVFNDTTTFPQKYYIIGNILTQNKQNIGQYPEWKGKHLY